MTLEKINGFVSRYERLLILGVVLGWLAINLPALLTYPTPNIDEAWFGAAAHNFSQTGSFGMPIFGDFLGSRENYTLIGRFYTVALAGWLRLFGVSLFSARSFSMLAALIGAGLTWQIGKKLTTPAFALLAGALYLFSWKVFFASHRVRPDIWIATAAAFMLWWYINQRGKHFALGLFAGALLNIYGTTVFLIVAMTIVVAVDRLHRHTPWRATIQYLIGLLLGIGLWALLTFLPDPAQAYQQIIAGPIGGTGTVNAIAPASYSPDQRLLSFVAAFNLGYLQATRLGWLELLSIAASVVSVAFRAKSADDRALLIFTLGMFGVMGLSTYVQSYQFVFLVPAVSLLMARAAQNFSTGLTAMRGFIFLAPLLLSYILGDAWLTWNSRAISYERYATAIRTLVPQNANILGDGSLWFELSEYPTMADFYLLFLFEKEARATPPTQLLERVFASRQIGIVLKTDRMGSWFPDGQLNEAEIVFYDEYFSYLKTRCQMRGVVEDYFWGVDFGGPALKRTEVWECPP